MTAQAHEAQPREFLNFRMGGEEYGIDILKVQEIRGFETPTRMVNAPPEMLGVLNLRGEIIPVMDLRVRFGEDEIGYNHETVTIVLNLDKRVVGVVVDAVSDVVAIAEEGIRPAPAVGGLLQQDHLYGMASLTHDGQDRMLILLKIENILDAADMAAASVKH